MLIYHKKNDDDMYSNVDHSSENDKKLRNNSKRGYKSSIIRVPHVIRAKASKRVARKQLTRKSKPTVRIPRKRRISSGKKRLLKKNAQFLEDLGLKVKA